MLPRTLWWRLVLLFSLLLCIAAAWFFLSREPRHDALFEAALQNADATTAYTQDSTVRLRLDDRMLEVRGIYRVDRKGRYASWATTTLIIPDEPPREFVLENISFGEEVYMRLTTEDPYLKKSIAHDPAWRHFSHTAIPAQFVDIAVWGPIIDNLLLFSEKGAYLSPEGAPVLDTGEQALQRYTLTRKDRAPAAGGTLAMLLDRAAGAEITVWVDEKESRIHRLLIKKEGYEADTLFLPFGDTPITPPL